jgi:hypothetical protein
LINLDILTVGVGFFAFGIFLLVHFITFRWVRPERLLKSLFMCVIVLTGLPLLLMVIIYILKIVNMSLMAWMCAAVLSSVIQGLLCFVYVLCVFGPYETSVRMRLVREIAQGGSNGISLEEILKHYNPQTIVNIRLQRLIGSGDIIEKDGLYRIGHSQNFFFIFDAIAGKIKEWIGR